jgi:hypothetical protein
MQSIFYCAFAWLSKYQVFVVVAAAAAVVDWVW